MIAAADVFGDRFCNLIAVGLVGVFVKHAGKLLAADMLQTLGGADAFFLIQT